MLKSSIQLVSIKDSEVALYFTPSDDRPRNQQALFYVYDQQFTISERIKISFTAAVSVAL